VAQRQTLVAMSHMFETQSKGPLQCWPWPHWEQRLPPQSMSVSVPSRHVLLHAMPVVHGSHMPIQSQVPASPQGDPGVLGASVGTPLTHAATWHGPPSGPPSGMSLLLIVVVTPPSASQS
jgi:hypothetical protein